MPRLRFVPCLAVLLTLILSTYCFAAPPDRITGPIVAAQTIRLAGGVPLQARPEFDQGPVGRSFKLSYVTLLTVPSAAQKKALGKLLADQQNPRSASYHKWLTPEQYADRFGLSPNDITKLTAWLQSQGFTVVRTARGRNWIAFSGTAAQMEKTFQVQIHDFDVKGEKHFANTTSPSIPAALSGIVVGLRGLNNFRPKSQARRAQPGYTFLYQGNNYFFIAPGDIAAIYDVNALYQSSPPIDGTGQAMAVVGQTGIYESDLTNFRQNFGLSAITCPVDSNGIIGQTACNTSNFAYVLVNGAYNTIYDNPNGEDDLPEADLDLEWSGATARNAQIIFVTATDPNGDGVWDSWYYAVDNDVAPVITMSYTAPCELAEAGYTGEGSIVGDEAELTFANSEGITFMSSAGDTGAAECDYGDNVAVYGYALAYPASSPEVTGVGGTSIPTVNPGEYTSTYWNSSNGSDGGSAKGYIPEQAWNDALEFAYYCEADNNKTGDTFCKDNGIGGGPLNTDWEKLQETVLDEIAAGGGGVSNCASVDVNDVCNGGFPQPSWQAGISASAINPNGYGVTTTPARYSPDVSLLASANFPGYIVCTQASAIGGTGTGSTCDSPTTGVKDMLNACFAGTAPCSIFGGTSVSSPVFAGMVTLLNQYLTPSAPGLGNINPMLYLLAATPANGAFNPVITPNTGAYSDGAWCTPGTPTSGVTGDPWPAALQCPAGGFLGFDSYNSDPTTNYNLVTGLGSVDLNNLATAWAGSRTASTIAVQASPTSVILGQNVTLTGTVTPSTAVSTVSFYDNASTTALGTATLSGGIGTFVWTPTASQVGTNNITASYSGDGYNQPSTTTVAAVVQVTSPDFSLSTNTPTHTVLAGQTTLPYNITVTALNGQSTFAADVNFACSFTDPTLTSSDCTQKISAGTTSPQTISFTVQTDGPNTGIGTQIRHRADKRLPWLPMTFPLAGVVMVGFAGRKLSKYSLVASLCVALALAGFLIACGSSSAPPPIGVSVSQGNPSSLYPNDAADGWPSQTATFTATVTNDSQNGGVTWSCSGDTPCGTFNPTSTPSGTATTYTSPTIAAGLKSPITITATSVTDATRSGSASETLNAATVPNGYTVTVTATEASNQHTQNVTLTVN